MGRYYSRISSPETRIAKNKNESFIANDMSSLPDDQQQQHRHVESHATTYREHNLKEWRFLVTRNLYNRDSLEKVQIPLTAGALKTFSITEQGIGHFRVYNAKNEEVFNTGPLNIGSSYRYIALIEIEKFLVKEPIELTDYEAGAVTKHLKIKQDKEED